MLAAPFPRHYPAPDETLTWRARAACGGVDPRLFDAPEAAEPTRAARRRCSAAAQICAGCPVAEACLLDAAAFGDAGVRGGVLLTRKNQSAAAAAIRAAAREPLPCGTYAAWRRHRRYGEPADDACKAAWAAYAAARRRRPGAG